MDSIQQPKVEEAPKQVVEFVVDAILSRSENPEKNTDSTIKRGPELTSATASESTNTKISEIPLGPSSSQISKPDPKSFNLPTPKLIPVIDVEVAPMAAPAIDPVRESSIVPAAPAIDPVRESSIVPAAPAIDPVQESSIVPMDLIPTAAPLLTGDGGQVKPASSPNAIPQPAPDTVSNETQAPSLPKQAFLGASATEDVARIIIKAKTTSWIQIRDDNANEILLTQLLREGDSYTVPRRTGLMLSAGNAGALTILVDGELVPSIGGIGDVVRVVLLDGVRLKMGTAVSE